MSDLYVRTFISELHTRLLNVCLEIEEDDLSSPEIAVQLLNIIKDMKQWL
jgi:hypothetical protein